MMKIGILSIILLLLSDMAMAQSDAWPVPGCKASQWRGAPADAATLARLERELALAKRDASGPDPVAKTNALAIALFSNGKLAQGEALFQSALAMWEKSGAAEESGMVASIAYLAEIANCRKAFNEAEIGYLRAVKTSEMFFGPRDRRMLAVLKNLAGFYYQQRRFAEGEVYFERAEAIRLRLSQATAEQEVQWATPDLVRHFRNGDMQAAQASAQKRVTQDEAQLQAQQQFVTQGMAELRSLDNPAADSSNNDAAKPTASELQQRKLATRAVLLNATVKLRQRQRSLALALNAQAELLHSLQQLPQAEALYLRALSILVQTASEKTLAAARILSDLGMLYRALGENAKALSHQQQALDIFLPKLGNEHPDVLNCEAELTFLRTAATTPALTAQ